MISLMPRLRSKSSFLMVAALALGGAFAAHAQRPRPGQPEPRGVQTPPAPREMAPAPMTPRPEFVDVEEAGVNRDPTNHQDMGGHHGVEEEVEEVIREIPIPPRAVEILRAFEGRLREVLGSGGKPSLTKIHSVKAYEGPASKPGIGIEVKIYTVLEPLMPVLEGIANTPNVLMPGPALHYLRQGEIANLKNGHRYSVGEISFAFRLVNEPPGIPPWPQAVRELHNNFTTRLDEGGVGKVRLFELDIDDAAHMELRFLVPDVEGLNKLVARMATQGENRPQNPFVEALTIRRLSGALEGGRSGVVCELEGTLSSHPGPAQAEVPAHRLLQMSSLVQESLRSIHDASDIIKNPGLGTVDLVNVEEAEKGGLPGRPIEIGSDVSMRAMEDLPADLVVPLGEEVRNAHVRITAIHNSAVPEDNALEVGRVHLEYLYCPDPKACVISLSPLEGTTVTMPVAPPPTSPAIPIGRVVKLVRPHVTLSQSGFLAGKHPVLLDSIEMKQGGSADILITSSKGLKPLLSAIQDITSKNASTAAEAGNPLVVFHRISGRSLQGRAVLDLALRVGQAHPRMKAPDIKPRLVVLEKMSDMLEGQPGTSLRFLRFILASETATIWRFAVGLTIPEAELAVVEEKLRGMGDLTPIRREKEGKASLRIEYRVAMKATK